MLKKIFFVNLLLLATQAIFAQEVSYPLQFISLRHARLGVGIGVDLGSNRITVKSPSSTYTSGMKPVLGTDWGLKLGFDLYAPYSVLGLYSEINFNRSTFAVSDMLGSTDTLQLDAIEIPLYLKLRIGKADAPVKFLLYGGAAYNIPVGLNRYWVNVFGESHEDKGTAQLNGQGGLSIGGGIGLEFSSKSKNFEIPVMLPGGGMSIINYPYRRFYVFMRIMSIPYNFINSNYTDSSYNRTNLTDGYQGVSMNSVRTTFGVILIFTPKQKGE
jgi:hypothetical protein